MKNSDVKHYYFYKTIISILFIIMLVSSYDGAAEVAGYKVPVVLDLLIYISMFFFSTFMV